MTENLSQRQTPEWSLAGTIQVDIVSSEQAIFSGRAKMVVVSGKEGEVGILPGHTQLLTAVKPGQVKLIHLDGREDYYYISGGFLEVQPEVVTILADTVVRAADIDQQRAEEAKANAKKMIAEKKLDDYTTALIELTKAIAQLRVAEKWHKTK